MKILAKWTVADYHRLIEAGIFCDRQIELLQGELVEMPPEGPLHSYVTAGGADYLRSLLQNLAYVREAHPITLENSEPQPDIAIVRLPQTTYRQRHPCATDIFWLIEVSKSTLDYDLNDKKQAYASNGIQDYWTIDVENKQVYIFRQPQGQNYLSEVIIRQGVINPLAFPDIEVSVARLLQQE